jgi:hypothetical protein
MLLNNLDKKLKPEFPALGTHYDLRKNIGTLHIKLCKLAEIGMSEITNCKNAMNQSICSQGLTTKYE